VECTVHLMTPDYTAGRRVMSTRNSRATSSYSPASYRPVQSPYGISGARTSFWSCSRMHRTECSTLLVLRYPCKVWFLFSVVATSDNTWTWVSWWRRWTSDLAGSTPGRGVIRAPRSLDCGLCSVLRPLQHSIGYMGDGLYRSKDPTNSIKVLKENLQRKTQTTQKHNTHRNTK